MRECSRARCLLRLKLKQEIQRGPQVSHWSHESFMVPLITGEQRKGQVQRGGRHVPQVE